MRGMRQAMRVEDDAEWGVIEPKLQAVMQAQRESRPGMMGMRGGRFGRGGPGAGVGEPSPMAQATQALGETLRNEDAGADEIERRLEAFRAAREAALADLETAREELRGVLSQRQEAMLVLMGMLD